MITKNAMSLLLIFALLWACLFPCTAFSDSCTHTNVDCYTIPTHEIIVGNNISHKVTIWAQTICKDCFETLDEEIYTTAEEPHQFEDDGSTLTCKWCEYQTPEEALQTSPVPTSTPTVTATPEAATSTPNPTPSEVPTPTPTPSTPLQETHTEDVAVTLEPTPIPTPLPNATEVITEKSEALIGVEPLWIMIAALFLLVVCAVCIVFLLRNRRWNARRRQAQTTIDSWSVSADFGGFDNSSESFFNTTHDAFTQSTPYNFVSKAPNASKGQRKSKRKAKQTGEDDFWGL